MQTNADTIALLKECDAGAKMAVSSIDEILEKVCDAHMKQILADSKDAHEKLKLEIQKELHQYNREEKDPNPMAKGMSWLKTNIKMSLDTSDATVADLITDGCDMGIKSLNRYLNQYGGAEASSKKFCRQLIDLEEKLRRDLKDYL